jgi:anaerobic selenocysteine-containing dehydrogenase
MPKGLWCRALPGGLTPNALAPDTLSDLAGGATFNDARVEIAPVR